jgi:hypothetical protein
LEQGYVSNPWTENKSPPAVTSPREYLVEQGAENRGQVAAPLVSLAIVATGLPEFFSKPIASRLNSAVNRWRFSIEHLAQGMSPFMGVRETREAAEAIDPK